jgi:hypothetical protein
MMLNTPRFALAGGLIAAVALALQTALAILGVPGFRPVTDLLTAWYGPYGYTVTWMGVLVGALWGFVEGVVWLGALSFVYNRLLTAFASQPAQSVPSAGGSTRRAA